jgi:outer membrane protein OmpA-like peptidoglycan-associated protein
MIDTVLLRRSHLRYVAALALASVAAACSGSARPPVELAQARAAYAEAARGNARRYALADLVDARAALDRAEALALSEPEAPETHTQAYVALRRAQKAEADAETRVATIGREAAERAALDSQAQQIAAMRSELRQSREQLAPAPAQVGAIGESRRGAEQRVDQARSALEKQTHNGARITVIPNKVLFVKDSAELLHGATGELDKVARVLRALPDRQIRIEGYTDPAGGDRINRPLSQARAQSVRNYLVSRGIDPSRLIAVGRASSDPIADNSTEAGRATNRRVEIVIPTSTGVAEPMPNDAHPAQPRPKPGKP